MAPRHPVAKTTCHAGNNLAVDGRFWRALAYLSGWAATGPAAHLGMPVLSCAARGGRFAQRPALG